MTSLPSVDLARIRHHAGSQHRAFEELAYLLAWDMEGLDDGTEIERRATPDGGIEFSCLPVGGGGGRWAWQAKYIFRFDASTFRQMTDSVISALESSPDLERYIFVLPKDRSTAGLRRWQTAAKEWGEEAKKRQMAVQFEFRGESQLLTALTRERHAGAIRYFFDEHFLTNEFLRGQVTREIENLGKRYDPRVHVETEARHVVDAACRGPRFVDELTSLVGAVWDARPQTDENASLEQVVLDGLSATRDLLDQWKSAVTPLIQRVSEPGRDVFARLAEAATRLEKGVEAQSTLVEARLDALRAERQHASALPRPTGSSAATRKRKIKAQEAEDERERRRRTLTGFNSALYRLHGALRELVRYLGSDEVQAAVGGSVLVVGEAGCGKSHLVADLAKERGIAALPSLLVLGQALVKGPLDPQLVNQLGLGSMPLRDVLQALDIAARVRNKGRALLIVDAINEGAGADLWEHQLRGFVTEVARYDWVALVITVRDTYEHAVAPHGAGEAIRSVHHGLAGHEEEALTLYAELYGLRLPDVPALLPELSNPLFLLSLCESVQGRGLREIPREAASLVWVFDGLIHAVDTTLSHPSRLDYGDWERRARQAVDALAAAMVDIGSESLSLNEARDICLTIHPTQRHSHSLLNGLLVEGLLLRERANTDGEATETIRFTYQRLSDHLRADALLERHSSDRDLAATVRAIARSPRPWAMSGVIQALVLLTPERRGRELARVLRLGGTVVTDRHGRRDDPSTWLRWEVQLAFVETLMWRAPAMFTPAAKDLLKGYLNAGVIDGHKWLHIITSLACVPNHPLNVEWLDPILRGMSLPERDDRWSRDLLWLYSDDENPIGRTIDWAWSTHDAPEDVARLTSRFLAWLCTSTNRRLRDTATKALVSVTINYTDLLAELVEHFIGVNDPYVMDRIVAAAYGHVLRRRHQQIPMGEFDSFSRLGEAVFDAVFDANPTTHLMLRHRARSCIFIIRDLLEGSGVDIERNVDRTEPPYDSSWPLRAPTARQLAAEYGREFTGYLGSATELDWDFEEKVVGRIAEDLALPNQGQVRQARRRRLVRRRDSALNELIDASPPSRKTRVRRRAERLISLTETLGLPQSVRRTREEQWEAFEASLSKASREQARKLHDVVRAIAGLQDETMRPDSDLCARWVAARVLELGWTKERFGDQDRRMASSYREPTTDRIAKKYERIALQELCGHLTDHCMIAERWRDTTEPYAGPWQISEALDLDSSLLLRGDEPESDTPAWRLRAIRLRSENEPSWWRTFIDHEVNTGGPDDDWLSDTSDIPHPTALLRAVDPEGREWVALERHQQWSYRDTGNLGEDYRRDRRTLWFRSQANIIEVGDTHHPAWAANKNWMGLHELSTPQNVWVAYIGEYPDIEPWPSLLDEGDRERRPYPPDGDPGADELPLGWEFAHIDDTRRSPYALATVWWHQENDNDFSAIDTPHAIMPSRILLDLLGAEWSAGVDNAPELKLGPVEREYSWVADGQVVAFGTAGREYGSQSALWIRAETLRKALAQAGLAMWSWTLSEKIYWSGGDPSTNRTDSFSGIRLAPGPVTVWGYSIERDHDRGWAEQGRRQRVHEERAPGIPE